MMEDKYNELISEGKSDNEAIGIVISEFGNLDELADSLGIKSFVNPSQAMPAAKTLSARLLPHSSGIRKSRHISQRLECCFA
ncbi:MAG: permease prefix domain 1-containing protein [Agathobacter rectalis]